MSNKEIGNSIFAGRRAAIDQRVIKEIANHHGEVFKFIKVSSTPDCDCFVTAFGAYDEDCSSCNGTGHTQLEAVYVKGIFQPFSYFSGSDNQDLILNVGRYERNRMKLYLSGDEFRRYQLRNGDFVRYRNVNYYIISIMPYTGTNYTLGEDDDSLMRELVFVEMMLSIDMKDTPFDEDTERIQ